MQLFQVNTQVGLHVIHYLSASDAGKDPVILVGGLASIPESLEGVINELSKDTDVYYVETREKTGSVIRGKVRFDIGTLGDDTVGIIGMLGVTQGKYILMGYSLGATILADCYRKLERKPRCMLFMEPTPVFHYPRWSLLMIRWLGVPFYSVMKFMAKWYLGTFRIRKREDPEMAIISFRALDHADPRKLRDAVLSIARYTVWDQLKWIDCPVLLVVASKDHLHVRNETERMEALIKNCRCVDLETNLRTHSAEMGEVARRYIAALR